MQTFQVTLSSALGPSGLRVWTLTYQGTLIDTYTTEAAALEAKAHLERPTKNIHLTKGGSHVNTKAKRS